MTALYYKQQRGVALITVLMILAIMVTIAATMTGRLTLSLKRTEGLTFSQKVYWYGQASAQLGKKILDENFSDSSVVSLDQMWATPNMVFPLENGQIAGRIRDLRSCFNINTMAVADQGGIPALPLRQFQNLLEVLGVSEYGAQMIAESTRDWIDENDSSDAALGAEDSYYQARDVAHLTANNLMTDISELRSVQGVGPKTYEKIEPYLCAIPSREQKINVNTVDIEQVEILYALFKDELNISLDDFNSLLQDRPTSGWANADEFFAMNIFQGVTITAPLKAQISVSSDFFQLTSIAAFEDRLLAVDLTFQVNAKKAEVIRYQSGGIK
ncbi:type II secretion system minor pseudopilin GspK [Psychromonas sp.]|uniref:type II secretion system minor pseudopilin GspK n=1 Tax=Psychromonas sp. TaxID=1884585 RepID=UPI00356AF271